MQRTLILALAAIPLLLAPSASATTFFGEGFEDGVTPFGWKLTGLWEVSSCNPHTGLYAVSYADPGLGCTYNAGNTEGSARLPLFEVPAGSSYLIFDSFSQTENECGAYDDRFVEISTDFGASWTLLMQECDENAWNLRVIDLSAFAGQEVFLRFRFSTNDGILNNFGGWSIDNVIVTDAAPPVPELPTLGLMAAGVGAIGFVALRRKN